jgi:NADPH:quinone reductase-like Zn-dependent oxidoreductase
MPKIKKVVITEFGDESKLAIVESETAEPAAGEVQVAVEYSVVAGADVNMRRVLIRFKRRRRSRPVIA